MLPGNITLAQYSTVQYGTVQYSTGEVSPGNTTLALIKIVGDGGATRATGPGGIIAEPNLQVHYWLYIATLLAVYSSMSRPDVVHVV